MDKALEWVIQNWEMLLNGLVIVTLAGLYLKKLGNEKVAQLLGHITTTVAVHAYDELKAEAAEVPVEELKTEVGEMYDVFVTKLPTTLALLVKALCSQEKSEELAIMVWQKWLNLEKVA